MKNSHIHYRTSGSAALKVEADSCQRNASIIDFASAQARFGNPEYAARNASSNSFSMREYLKNDSMFASLRSAHKTTVRFNASERFYFVGTVGLTGLVFSVLILLGA